MCVPGDRLYHSRRGVLEGVLQVVLEVTKQSPCASFHHVKKTSPIAGLHVWRRGTCQGNTEKIMAPTTPKPNPASFLNIQELPQGVWDKHSWMLHPFAKPSKSITAMHPVLSRNQGQSPTESLSHKPPTLCPAASHMEQLSV